MRPAMPASTALPPRRMTSSVVSVTMGCRLEATAETPVATPFGPPLPCPWLGVMATNLNVKIEGGYLRMS